VNSGQWSENTSSRVTVTSLDEYRLARRIGRLDRLPLELGWFPLDNLSPNFDAAECVAFSSFPRPLQVADFWLNVAEKQKGQPMQAAL
jgi:hypothetical protein